MPLINSKIHLELNWTKACVMSVYGDKKFNIIDTELLVPIVTLSPKDNAKLTKQLNNGFKSSIYWNKYNSHFVTQNGDNNNPIRF